MQPWEIVAEAQQPLAQLSRVEVRVDVCCEAALRAAVLDVRRVRLDRSRVRRGAQLALGERGVDRLDVHRLRRRREVRQLFLEQLERDRRRAAEAAVIGDDDDDGGDR